MEKLNNDDRDPKLEIRIETLEERIAPTMLWGD